MASQSDYPIRRRLSAYYECLVSTLEHKILSDLFLARRLERAEAHANRRFVEARARLDPGSGATWMEAAGAYAMFDGPQSPCTQTFGLGMFGIPTNADWERIEAFFQERAAPVFHEVSPMAPKELLGQLSDRGYRPMELTTVMFLPLAGRRDAGLDSGVRVRVLEQSESELWARTSAEGWREFAGLSGLILDLGRVIAGREDAVSFLAEIEGHPAAAGALALHDGVALFAGASTIPEWRNRGAQRALLEARLDFAVRVGCGLAMMCAEPGSTSQRNAEPAGFRIAYTRIKWELYAQF